MLPGLDADLRSVGSARREEEARPGDSGTPAPCFLLGDTEGSALWPHNFPTAARSSLCLWSPVEPRFFYLESCIYRIRVSPT